MSATISEIKPGALKQAQRANITRPSRETSEFRLDETLWLDKNENMDPHYLQFIQTLLTDLPGKALFGYPDCHALYKKIADHVGVSINQLFIAAGSDGIIRTVYDAFVMPGDNVIYTNPTFAMYSLYAQMYGANAVELQYAATPDGPTLLAEDVIRAILMYRPRLIGLPNPNSPSGTVFTLDEMRFIIQAAMDTDAIILVDEAYHPFYDETVLPLLADSPRLIIARSFSKAWGCAGIRMGYGIGAKPIMDTLHRIRPMYEAGALSVTIAERLLDHPEQMLQSVARLKAGKNYFLTEMQSLGFKTLPSQGNFLHVAFAQHASAIHTVLQDKVLYRHNFGHPSLAGYSRFSATTQEQFEPVVQLIRTIINNK
jgi:histidinol-phosphate aminotransferase